MVDQFVHTSRSTGYFVIFAIKPSTHVASPKDGICLAAEIKSIFEFHKCRRLEVWSPFGKSPQTALVSIPNIRCSSHFNLLSIFVWREVSHEVQRLVADVLLAVLLVKTMHKTIVRFKLRDRWMVMRQKGATSYRQLFSSPKIRTCTSKDILFVVPRDVDV